MALQFIRIENKPVDSNCYILFEEESLNNSCLIIDPGSEDSAHIVEIIENKKLRPTNIILTHEHFDHCWSVNTLIEKYNTGLIASSKTAELIKNSKKNFSLFYGYPFEILGHTTSIESLNFCLLWNGNQIKFSYSPGHTQAGIFIFTDRYVFTGDTLIPNIKTVTKLFTGSKEDLKESIQFLDKLKGTSLTVLPGHGEPFALDTYNLNTAF